jgi:hypothetical protein
MWLELQLIMSASPLFEQEYCPFCGTDTDRNQRYCHGCGSLLEGLTLMTSRIPHDLENSNLKVVSNTHSLSTKMPNSTGPEVLPFPWMEDVPKETIWPTWIQYAGVIQSLQKPLLFWDVLDQVIGRADITFSPNTPGIVISFQFDSYIGLDSRTADWTITYELNNNRLSSWVIYDSKHQSIGFIESKEISNYEKELRARDSLGNQVSLQGTWTKGRAFQTTLFKAMLDLFFHIHLWQGFGSNYTISCCTKERRQEQFALISTGGIGGTFFQLNCCNDLTSHLDFRLVFSLLSLQAFGIWDPSQLDDILKLRY